jgi:flagellar basal-body rod protein FlgB
MFDPVRSDLAIQISRLALDGLTMRQDIISNNIVNVDTPDYHAQKVEFEESLKRILAGDEKPSLKLTKTHEQHLDSTKESALFAVSERNTGTPRADNNDVDIDQELVELNETGMRHAALTQLVSRKLRLLKAIAMAR